MVTQANGVRRFVVDVPDAEQVYLTGDFNNWSVPGLPMKQTQPGSWELKAELPPGQHRVSYYVIRWRWNDETGPKGQTRRGFSVGGGLWIHEPSPVAVG